MAPHGVQQEVRPAPAYVVEEPEPTFFFNPLSLVVTLVLVLLVTWALIWGPVA